MNLRKFVFALGAILVITGGIFLVTPLSVVTVLDNTVDCGSAIDPAQPGAAFDAVQGDLTPGETDLLRAALFGPASGITECGDAIPDRQTWTWVTIGVGGAALIGGCCLPRRPRAGNRETAPAFAGDESGNAGA